jgi:hypothetical protein
MACRLADGAVRRLGESRSPQATDFEGAKPSAFCFGFTLGARKRGLLANSAGRWKGENH